MAEIVEYPRWRYHKTLEACIVQDKEEHDVLTPDSEGWLASPYKGSSNDQDDVHAEADVTVAEPAVVEEAPEQSLEDEENEPVPEVEESEADESPEPITEDQVSEGNVAEDSDTGEFSFSPEDGDQY